MRTRIEIFLTMFVTNIIWRLLKYRYEFEVSFLLLFSYYLFQSICLTPKMLVVCPCCGDIDSICSWLGEQDSKEPTHITCFSQLFDPQKILCVLVVVILIVFTDDLRSKIPIGDLQSKISIGVCRGLSRNCCVSPSQAGQLECGI